MGLYASKACVTDRCRKEILLIISEYFFKDKKDNTFQVLTTFLPQNYINSKQ